MHLIIYIHLFAFTIAGISFVYTQILIQPDHILGGWWKWINEKLTTSYDVPVIKRDPLTGSNVMVGHSSKEKKIEWLLKPLGGCIYCNSGQLALWLWLLHFVPGVFNFMLTDHPYNIPAHLGAVVITILYAHILMQLFNPKK